MQLIDTVDTWRKTLDAARANGLSVGLVPTMGALHAGHAALIARAARECDVVGVTVFVNPLQFGANEDLSKYPRSLDADIALAETHGAACVFAPSVEQMYPRPVATTVHVDGVSTRWEGESRPGHFDGVATVVSKLFAQAGACRAYFGEKDFQQLAVIRRLVADLNIAVDVIGCETAREPDGLALSSRNVYLSPEERAAAPAIYAALRAAAARLALDGDIAAATTVMFPGSAFDVDYVAIVDPDSLEPLDGVLPVGASARLLIAARLGRTRLIDNMGVTR